jgi:hypothetical protein
MLFIKYRWIVASFILCTIISPGCYKHDMPSPTTQPDFDRFFSAAQDVPPVVTSIMKMIKHGNSESEILSVIADEGYPLWDKNLIETVAGELQIKIPLINDNEDLISSYIFARFNKTTSRIELIRGKMYKRYGYEGAFNANHIAHDLIMLNQKVYKESTFLIEDSLLFGLNKLKNINFPYFINYQSNAIKGGDSSLSQIVSNNLMANPCNRTVTVNYCLGSTSDTGPVDCPVTKVVYGTTTCTPPTQPIPPSNDPYSYPVNYSHGGQPGMSIVYPSCPVGMSPATCEAYKVPVTRFIYESVATEMETSIPYQDGSAWAWWDRTLSVPGLVVQAQARPSFNLFVSRYPKVQSADGLWHDMPSGQICQKIGGEVYFNYARGYANNSCAIRTSYALNYSGVLIPNIPGQTWRGFDGKYYFYTVPHLFNWLCKALGDPEVQLNSFDGSPNGEGFLPKLRSGGIVNKGIYMMKPYDKVHFNANGHATFFGGFDVFDSKGYFPAAAWVYVWRFPQP